MLSAWPATGACIGKPWKLFAAKQSGRIGIPKTFAEEATHAVSRSRGEGGASSVRRRAVTTPAKHWRHARHNQRYTVGRAHNRLRRRSPRSLLARKERGSHGERDPKKRINTCLCAAING